MRMRSRLCGAILVLAASALLPAVNLAQSGASAISKDTDPADSSSSATRGVPRSAPAFSADQWQRSLGLKSLSSPLNPPAVPVPAANGNQGSRHGIGAGVRLSSLGLGGEAAVALTPRSNLRGGFSAFGYSRGFSKDGISYAAQLSLRSVEAHYDWYPFAGRFHLSPGLMVYDGNKATATASVPGGQTFTLGGTEYLSQPSGSIGGNGKVEFNKVAPTFLVGFGNLVPRHGWRFSVNFEAGVVFHGSPQATLGLTGTVCAPTGLNCRNAATDPTVQSSIVDEQRKLDSDMSAFKVYPVISLGFSYRFR